MKRVLRDIELDKIEAKVRKERLAYLVQKTMFGVDEETFDGFFKRSLHNMIQFWYKME